MQRVPGLDPTNRSLGSIGVLVAAVLLLATALLFDGATGVMGTLGAAAWMAFAVCAGFLAFVVLRGAARWLATEADRDWDAGWALVEANGYAFNELRRAGGTAAHRRPRAA